MKRILISILLLFAFATMSSAPASAGSSETAKGVSYSKLESLISSYKDAPGFDVNKIGRLGTGAIKALIKRSFKAESKEDAKNGTAPADKDKGPDTNDIIKMVRGVKKITVVDYDECPSLVKAEITQKLDEILVPEGMIMEVKKHGDVMKLYGVLDEKSEKLRNFVLYAPEDHTIICLFGTISLNLINKTLAKDSNCFGIIAGRNATKDGTVLFAHNEDDDGEQMLCIYHMPASGQRTGYLWFEFPGLKNADAYLNEYGVAIATDNCPSREDCEPGKLQYEVRTTAAGLARSAKDGVKIIGRLIEEQGYADSGRSYLLADSREAWVCSVVRGHHWVAQRVPDDEVMAIPNYYVIGAVNLSDTVNFLGSADIVEYAVKRGWYNPEKDGEFNFRLAYSSDKALNRKHNIERHDVVQKAIFGNSVLGNQVPFSRKADHKITVKELEKALGLDPVCNSNTVLSSVFRLDSRKPVEKGCVMWNSYAGQSRYVKWTLNSTVPSKWQRYPSAQEALRNHFTDTDNLRKRNPDSPYWPYLEKRGY